MSIGVIKKMKVEATNPVSYSLPIGKEQIDMNLFVGSNISMKFTGNIFCIHCGRKTNKSFNQGYCFPCVRRLAACDSCIVRPELCHYDQGTCREPAWGEANCMQTHLIYLANSSNLKVGITRATQIPNRWIDQGAVQALPIYEVDSRLMSGLIEVALKSFVSDRTEWRKMLRGSPPELDLNSERDHLLEKARFDLEGYQSKFGKARCQLVTTQRESRFEYPVLNYPDKILTHNFDKKALVEGFLQGIKGQYLMFDTGVLNIRKFAGYEIDLQKY